MIILLLAASLVSAWLYLQRRRNRARDRWERVEQRPRVLRDARLIMSERRIYCDWPLALSGRVDQVYELADGSLCVVDSKRRRWPRVYASDVIQTSVYAEILRARGFQVHDQGYIRQVWDGQIRYLPFRVLDTNALRVLVDRYRSLRSGNVVPNWPPAPGLCRTCGQREMRRCEGVQISAN